MKMRVKFFYFSVILTIKIGFSQNEKITNYIYEGNKNNQTEAFVEAEKSYRKALSLSPEKPEALYNLGNTHFLDKQYDEASQRFFQTQKFATTKEAKHLAFHNMGNVYMQKKEYKKAVNRNHLKRLVRGTFRIKQDNLGKLDYVVMAKKTQSINNNEMKNDLLALMTKATNRAASL